MTATSSWVGDKSCMGDFGKSAGRSETAREGETGVRSVEMESVVRFAEMAEDERLRVRGSDLTRSWIWRLRGFFDVVGGGLTRTYVCKTEASAVLLRLGCFQRRERRARRLTSQGIFFRRLVSPVLLVSAIVSPIPLTTLSGLDFLVPCRRGPTHPTLLSTSGFAIETFPSESFLLLVTSSSELDTDDKALFKDGRMGGATFSA